MFALIGTILAVVGLIMTLVGAAVPAWILWAVLTCICGALLVGVWPFNSIVTVRRTGS